MPSSGKRVLVVDDEPGLAELAAEYLGRVDDEFVVTTATTATEGLELLRGDDEFDCVVSDYNMPEMNGLEFLEAVREQRATPPFILYTGKGSEEIASEAISAGVTDYLQKDTGTEHYEVLANRIENAISENRAKVELRETGERIEALHQTAARAATCTDRVELCQLAVEAAEEILAFDLCDLSLREDDELVPQAVSKGVPTDGYYLSTSVDAEDTFGARAFRSGESIRINDLRAHGVAPAESDYRSSLTIPIDDHGVFQAVSRDVDGFGDRDLELAELLLAHVSAALDRIASEEQLRNERDKFAALFRNIPHAIGVGEFEDGDPVITEANPTFEEVFGWDIDHISGGSIDDLIVPEGGLDEAETINREMQNGEQISGREVRRVTADGVRDFLLDTVCAPHEHSDEFVIYTDITDQKRRERELQRQNERLDEFAAVLGHDLRNPLEVADGHARLVEDDCDSEHVEPLRDTLTRIEERVDEVLELAEQGRSVSDPSAVPIREVVDEAWGMVETGEASLATAELPEQVSGDRQRLSRLFENLFRNAVEHGSTGSRPVADDAVEHGSTGNQPAVEDAVEHGSTSSLVQNNPVTVEVGQLDYGGLYVEDDGVGVDGDHDRLFERGYTTSDEGTGLGLRIVRDIAHAHGWSVRAADERNSRSDDATTGLRIEIAFQDVDT